MNGKKMPAILRKLDYFPSLYIKNALNISGKSCRQEFWYPATIILVAYICLQTMALNTPFVLLRVLLYMAIAILLIPMPACIARRLRDTNRSLLWLGILPMPFVNVYILRLMLKAGETTAEIPESYRGLAGVREDIALKRAEQKAARAKAKAEQRVAEQKEEATKVLSRVAETPYLAAYRNWHQLRQGDYLIETPLQPHHLCGDNPLNAPPDSKISFYFEDGRFAVRSGADWKPVVNEKRAETIEDILEQTGIFGDNALAEIDSRCEMPYLYTLNRTPNPLDSFVRKPAHESVEIGYSKFADDLHQAVQVYQSLLNQLFSNRVRLYMEDYRGVKTGLDGEKAVREQLALHRDAFITLHNLRIEQGNERMTESAEVDTLVLAPNGIYSIEVKNIGSEGECSIVVEADGSWYREIPSRNPDEKPHLVPMRNPFGQNDRHIAVLERFINGVLGRSMENRAKVKNVIVIANENVRIVSNTCDGLILTRVPTLYSQLSNDKEVCYTQQELESLSNILGAVALPPKGYKLYDYSAEMRGYISAYLQLDNYEYDLLKRYKEVEDTLKASKEIKSLPQHDEPQADEPPSTDE